MKLQKIIVLACALVLLLSACAPVTMTPAATGQPADQSYPSYENYPSGPTSGPGLLPEPPTGGHPVAVSAAQKDLAERLGLTAKEIGVKSVEAVEWRDSCLGLGGPAEICLQAVTPGYRVILIAGGVEYEYHTNQNGTALRLATDAKPGPVTGENSPLIVWHREGGIAGFCDDVTVYVSGEYTVSNCKGGTTEPLKGTLTESQFEQLKKFVADFQSFEKEVSDGAVADSMTVRTVFTGVGKTEATEADVQAIGAFAAELASIARYAAMPDPERAEAETILRQFLGVLNSGDFTQAAKLYGGDTSTLETWNPDIKNDLTQWLERGCTQNGLMCLPVRSVTYRGPDERGGHQFLVEFSNTEGKLFHQGPCCGETSGPAPSSFLFAVIKEGDDWRVMDLPPYVP